MLSQNSFSSNCKETFNAICKTHVCGLESNSKHEQKPKRKKSIKKERKRVMDKKKMAKNKALRVDNKIFYWQGQMRLYFECIQKLESILSKNGYNIDDCGINDVNLRIYKLNRKIFGWR